MPQAPALLEPVETEPQVPELHLLIETDSWWRTFRRNLSDLFRAPDDSALHLQSAPGTFWPDVFVDRKLPWRRFWQSGAAHVLALAFLWAGSRFLILQPHVTAQPIFSKADVVFYTPSEYLPPLDTRPRIAAPARNADPEFSAQPIISVPPQADNHSQTIVTAPNIQLEHDVPLPNIVAWSGNPQLPIAPAPAVPVSEITRLAPRLERSVIAPPPVAPEDVRATSRPALQSPQAAVIAPPPAAEAVSTRRLGDLNIGRSSVIAPAPQLSLDAQRAPARRSSTAVSGRSSQVIAPQVIAPPPSLGASSSSHSGGGVIALSLHPAVDAPLAPPEGKRRGSFAAGTEGHRGASGAAGASAGNGKADASGSAGSEKKSSGDLPSGLYVGKNANTTSAVAGKPAAPNASANSVNPKLIAGARPPRASSRAMQPESESKLSDVERSVFGNRKFYSLSLNMPNLNSASGSWIIRFAALKADSTPSSLAAHAAAAEDPPLSAAPTTADLSAPVATRKVDPAYPLELMRQNVAGTVILYGVIHADGTVGSVRVLRSVDDQLDQFASQAIAKWQFQPATKNGSAVDVEATFWIPFRPSRF
jgi:TonB family protein